MSSAAAAPVRLGDQPVLEVADLAVRFTRRGEPDTRAVDGVSFSVAPGETIGLVGESGCGKSVTSLAVMGLLPARNVEVSGSVRLDGRGARRRRATPRCAACAAPTWRWSSRTRCPP